MAGKNVFAKFCLYYMLSMATKKVNSKMWSSTKFEKERRKDKIVCDLRKFRNSTVAQPGCYFIEICEETLSLRMD